MVRATRSTAALQNQDHQHSQPSRKQTKKRKRTSAATELEDQPPSKQPRADSRPTEEGQGAGDVPLDPQHAAKILDVLEMIDTQGLLDRVFPLPESDQTSTAKASTSKEVIKTYSLRALLKDSAIHPLRVLRSAIQPLFPISSHPRSRPSIPAAQQLHFCNLALSLLDQSSSSNSSALSLSQSTLFPDSEDSSTSESPDKRRTRYALVQKLPTGEWWSSLNSVREAEPGLTPSEAKEMRKGHAELVSVIPTLPLPASSMPTLGELQMEGRRESRAKFKSLHIHSRALSAGTFLDYGPYTSFAPAFDSEGAEVGRDGLGEVLMGRMERRKIREARRKLVARLQAAEPEYASIADTPCPAQDYSDSMGELLSSLFPDERTDGLRAALQELQVEEGAASLLEQNARALERLNLLQTIRLRAGDSAVKVNSEEWTIAQEIMNSLTLLISLQPRLSTSNDGTADSQSIIPPPAVIRALHPILPMAPTHGWQGTLDEARKTALRDDATVHVRAGAVQPSIQSTTTQSQPYSSQYRPVGYPYQPQTQTRPGQPQAQGQAQNSYYPNAYLQGQVAGSSAPYQYQGNYTYPPGTWYGYPTGQKPTVPGAAAVTPFYGNYLPQAGATTAAGTPRAVGNTAKPQQQPQANGWAHGYGQSQSAATLPPHLRRTGTATPTGTQTPTQGYAPYNQYVSSTQVQGR